MPEHRRAMPEHRRAMPENRRRQYKRRPMTVTAYQFDGTQMMAEKLLQWYISCKGNATPVHQSMESLRKAIDDPSIRPSMSYDPQLGLVEIATPNGTIELMPKDWLVHSPSHAFVAMTDEDFQEEHYREEHND